MNRPHHTECECANCGASFWVQTLQIEKHSRGKYCSRACMRKRQGYRQAVLAAMPGTLNAICSRIGISESAAIRRIKALMAEGQCHAARLIPAPYDALPGGPDLVLCYDRGPGQLDDVPHAVQKAMPYFYRLAVLASMPAPLSELAEITGLSLSTVSRIVRTAIDSGDCHTSSWRKNVIGQYVGLYTAGPGRNRLKPKINKISGAESCRRYKARLVEAGQYEEFRTKENNRRKRQRTAQQGDPLVNAFFGTPAQRKQRQEAA